MRGWINRCRDDEGGASMLEYALLIALSGVACVAAFQQLGEPRQAVYKKADTPIKMVTRSFK